MKKSGEMRYRIRLTEYELRVMINALNAVRLERDGEGKDTSCLCELLLRLLIEHDSAIYNQFHFARCGNGNSFEVDT